MISGLFSIHMQFQLINQNIPRKEPGKYDGDDDVFSP